MTDFVFDIKKYMGTWYELMHYPSWFQRNDNYNTMAQYSLNNNGTVSVHNSTIANGKPFDSYGSANLIGPGLFHVKFPIPEISKISNSPEFKINIPTTEYFNPLIPNYAIDTLWTNAQGDYIFAVVTDLNHNSLYVLSRFKHPCLKSYSDIMNYVISKFDRDRLVQTPQFD